MKKTVHLVGLSPFVPARALEGVAPRFGHTSAVHKQILNAEEIRSD